VAKFCHGVPVIHSRRAGLKKNQRRIRGIKGSSTPKWSEPQTRKSTGRTAVRWSWETCPEEAQGKAAFDLTLPLGGVRGHGGGSKTCEKMGGKTDLKEVTARQRSGRLWGSSGKTTRNDKRETKKGISTRRRTCRVKENFQTCLTATFGMTHVSPRGRKKELAPSGKGLAIYVGRKAGDAPDRLAGHDNSSEDGPYAGGRRKDRLRNERDGGGLLEGKKREDTWFTLRR